MTSSLVVGTPSYMAPERIHGGEATPATDIFSLGATMYYAATGRTLVDDSDTVYAQMMHIIKGRFDLDRVPNELRPMIMRCLSADPRDRPTAAELSQMLTAAGVSAPEPGWHQAISDVPFSAVLTPRRVPRASRRRVLLAGVLVGLATVGGVAAGLIGRAVNRDDDGSTDGSAAGGKVLWQGRSGAEPVPIVYGRRRPLLPRPRPPVAGPPPSGRPEPVAVWLVPLGRRAMVAGTRADVRAGGPDAGRWNRPVSNGLAALLRWGDSVLVADGTAVARLNPATGDQEFRIETGPVRRVVVTASVAYVGAGGAARLDPPGTAETGSTAAPASGAYSRGRWAPTEASRGGVPAAAPRSTPTTRGSSPTTGSATGCGSPCTRPRPGIPVERRVPGARRGRREFDGGGSAAGWSRAGRTRWARRTERLGWPGPAAGRPPRPVYTHSWNYTQAVIIGEHVVFRDASEVRALRLATGEVVWDDTAPTPITDLDRAGDLVLVASDRVTARRSDSGDRVWAAEPPGARVAAHRAGRW